MLKVLVSCSCLLFPVAATASQTFKCKLKIQDDFGLLSDCITFVLDKANRTTLVDDPIIQFLVGEPLEVKLNTKLNGTSLVRWSVSDFPATRTKERDGMLVSKEEVKTSIRYVANLSPKQKSVRVRALSGSTRGPDIAIGNCVVRET